MDSFVVRGAKPLKGRIRVNGSKNAGLPILIATLLTDQTCVVDNVPDLRDIRTTYRLLEVLGKKVTVKGKRVVIEHGQKLKLRAPYDIVKQMRASVLVAGPLLARFGKVWAPIPGGCSIGLRPIDLHIKGFAAMGAGSTTRKGDVILEGRLKAKRIKLSFPSVGATENLMMAAAATPGTTVIENAAREPEIEDLADLLSKMGARVTGAGSKKVTVVGAKVLNGVKHRVIADRIETGTLMLAVATAEGDVTLVGAIPSHLTSLIDHMRRAGCKITEESDGIRVRMKGRPKPVNVATKPHPGFPTDVQAPWMSFMSRCKGRARVHEAIFERRFMHAAELNRLGAEIAVDGDRASIRGVAELEGTSIMSSDIRAGAALVVAALAANGTTTVQRVYHIDRGHEELEKVLRRVGARIRRVPEGGPSAVRPRR